MSKQKTPKQHVLEALRSGNKEKIQKYLKRYWELQVKEKKKTGRDIVKKTREIFEG